LTINIITLGCSKNLVDSERLLFQLDQLGHKVFHDSEDFSDCVIINTCGFILDAKTESIETILSYVDAKKKGFIERIIVIGCLSERYRDSLQEEIPELDGIFGVNEPHNILKALEEDFSSENRYDRITTTPSHYAYLKISEGCNRSCAFCAIPGIRGKQVSVPVPDLVKETEKLASAGVKELLLIAQELTSYGSDLSDAYNLPVLLKELVKIEGIEWIRLHYNYPSGFPADEIAGLMKEYPQLCRYLDIPVQHASEKVLKSMNRGHTREDVEHIISVFRKEIPDISIRTTLITGFPGEGENEFSELLDFVEKTRFDRLGAFTYSHEEGTPAYKKLIDNVPGQIKEQRKEKIMEVQEAISLDKNLSKLGQRLKVIIDRREDSFFIGRTQYDSPEVDNEVLIPVEESPNLETGQFYIVEIFDALEFDLYGKPV